MLKCFDMIQKTWLNPKRGTKFMFGDKPSIADLSLACELTQIASAGFPLREKYPAIGDWFFNSMMTVKCFKELHDLAVSQFSVFIKMSK